MTVLRPRNVDEVGRKDRSKIGTISAASPKREKKSCDCRSTEKTRTMQISIKKTRFNRRAQKSRYENPQVPQERRVFVIVLQRLLRVKLNRKTDIEEKKEQETRV